MTGSLLFTRATSDWPADWTAATRIYLDRDLGLLSVEHDGSIAWDELQSIKDRVAGTWAVAIEVYPPAGRVVNNIAMRHLWLLGRDDWWPDLGREGCSALNSLRDRYTATMVTSTGAAVR